MTPFIRLNGPAVPLREDNVDTDIIFPARFLLITARGGLGDYAFHDRRFTADGLEDAGFVLNREPWRAAPVLIAGANFGCGSSREQAVWALLGRGIRCVIAPGFGEIFRGNCLRNGLLPITLPGDVVSGLQDAAAAGSPFAVDLEQLQIAAGPSPPIAFVLPEEQRLALLNGWDETETILNTHASAIAGFEAVQRRQQPWLYASQDAS